MNELALFAGCGGLQLATQHLLGFRTICYVEKNPYCIEVLKARIQDRLLDDAPIWDDARTFDGLPWAGKVDILTAGFPCQPWSISGKQQGEFDERNLWSDTLRIIRQIRPEWILLENVPNLLFPLRGRDPYFGQILSGLTGSGYDARWGCLSASSFGASHKRRRLWIVAHAHGAGWPLILHSHAPHSQIENPLVFRRGKKLPSPLDAIRSLVSQLEKSLGEPSVCGNDDGIPNRVERLKAVGNGVVPIVAEAAWQILSGQE